MPSVIVIGAGASGLMAAIVAARNNANVTIIERMNKAGKKIFATGNGKCNYTNTYYDSDCYRGDDTSIVGSVLKQFSVNDTIEFFKNIGIYPTSRDGYIYPNSNQASSVVEVLMMEVKALGIKVMLEENVVDITKEKNGYLVITDKKRYKSDKVIVAAGGMASPKLGSDGSLFRIVKKMGIKIVKPLPALVSLKCCDKSVKKISGVRTKARVSMCGHTQEGEIIFTDTGVSGIPVMQLSRYASKMLDKKKKVYINIDLLPDIEKEDLIKLLKARKNACRYKDNYQILVGLLNNKLANYVLEDKISYMADRIKNLVFEIKETNSFENAQVTAGGVSTSMVDASTMESKLHKGLYFTGEILDIDGTCGGYNLQWAWSTGYIAGCSVSK